MRDTSFLLQMPQPPDRLFSLLEYAPAPVVYALHAPYWAWLSVKHGGVALPAIANPTILTGGLCGESKTDMFELVGAHARRHFAPFITFRADAPAADVRAARVAAGLAYPLVAKPDIGRNGRGVKIIGCEEELAPYLAAFPREARMLLQTYIADEGEAGVFYVRKPSEARGRITSLTLKYFPSVMGNGSSTLRELILGDPRASKIAHIYLRRNWRGLDRVIPAGETHRLVSVGNHVRGARFVDGEPHVTDALTEAFDWIAKDIRGFYFGRFDVRFAKLDDLKNGTDFTIIEYNGASSEPTHVWDRRTGLAKTYRDMLAHWRYAFEVGAELRDRGVRPVSPAEILRVRKMEMDLLNHYPDEE